MVETQVLIVGAGPVGLTLAIDLGQRGVRCTLIEKKEAPAFLPKMERVNARSMEIYRRMGLAERIRLGEVADVLDPLFALFAASRRPEEGFGDFCHRVGVARLREVLAATRAEPRAAAD